MTKKKASSVRERRFTPVKKPWSSPRSLRGKASKALDAFMSKGVSAAEPTSRVSAASAVAMPTLSEILQSNASVAMPKDRVAAILDWTKAEDRQVFDASEFEGNFSVEDASLAITHPAFIRGAARRGMIFYVDSKGKIRLQTIRGKAPKLAKPKYDLSTLDTDFYLKPKWYARLMQFIKAKMRVLLIGPAGVGKSEAVQRIFRELEQRLLVVSCNPSMTADDFEGRTELRESAGGVTETVFTPAAPVIALEKGYGLLLDEADAVAPEACYALYRILDGRSMHILRKGYEGEVDPHDAFRAIGTQNTEGRGDAQGLFHGRAYQDEAMLDRWNCYIKTTYPEKGAEIIILQKRTGICEDGAKNVQDAAARMRKALEADKMLMSVSLRRTQSVCQNLVAGMSPGDAWNFAVKNRATREDAATIDDFLNRVYGSKLGTEGAV